MRIRMKLFHQRNHSQFNSSQSGAVGDFIMAGITTSETMAGEQPKDDNLGSRVDELTKQVEKLREEYVTWRNYYEKLVDARLEEIEKKV